MTKLQIWLKISFTLSNILLTLCSILLIICAIYFHWHDDYENEVRCLLWAIISGLVIAGDSR